MSGPSSDEAELEKRASAALDRAMTLLGPSARSRVEAGWDETAEHERSVSTEELVALGWDLIDWADELERTSRAHAAMPFLEAAIALPRAKLGVDPEVAERVYRVAYRTGSPRAPRHRRALLAANPSAVAAIEAAPPPEADAPTERYEHERFGIGELVRREDDKLRIRFESGERLLRADRVVRR